MISAETMQTAIYFPYQVSVTLPFSIITVSISTTTISAIISSAPGTRSETFIDLTAADVSTVATEIPFKAYAFGASTDWIWYCYAWGAAVIAAEASTEMKMNFLLKIIETLLWIERFIGIFFEFIENCFKIYWFY